MAFTVIYYFVLLKSTIEKSTTQSTTKLDFSSPWKAAEHNKI